MGTSMVARGPRPKAGTLPGRSPWLAMALPLPDAAAPSPCPTVCPRALPPPCSFPMPKDSLLHARLRHEGLGRTFTPTCPDAATLCLAHDPAYVQAFLDGSISPAAMRQIGLPWSQALVQRTLVGVGSAILAARLALQLGLAVMCNGGTHHAHYGHGSGARGGEGP